MTEIDAGATTQESVEFAPRQLPPRDRWRFVLRRLYTRSSNPLRFAVLRCLFLVAFCAFVGVWLALVDATTIPPAVMAVFGGLVGLILPLQIVRAVRGTLRQVDAYEVFVVDLGPTGITVRTADRVALVLWRAVTGVHVYPREVVIRFRTPDVVSVPALVFRDAAHRDRFIALIQTRIAAQC